MVGCIINMESSTRTSTVDKRMSAKVQALKDVSVAARTDPDVYINFFNLMRHAPENSVVAATNHEVGSVPTNLHGKSGFFNGFSAHFAVFEHEAAAMALMESLYKAYKTRNHLSNKELLKVEAVQIAVQRDSEDRTVFQIAYLRHSGVKTFVETRPGFRHFLFRQELI